MIASVWKPWYLFRPLQLARRAWGAVRGPGAPPTVVRLPWGVEIELVPTETIGRAIWTTGIYDLAVSEALWRLTRPGDLAVDAGANIGYMTGLLAVRAGATGRVLAFEPHPAVADKLRANVARVTARPGTARIEVRQTGLSGTAGVARLQTHPDATANHGLAFIGDGEGGLSIRTERLDEVVGADSVGVLKLDVEGHEPAVLAGAGGLLADRRIRHLVFEDHTGPKGEVRRVLEAAGYRVYGLGWRMRGPVLGDPDGPPVRRHYEPPNYLATVAPAEVERTMSRRGWDLFR